MTDKLTYNINFDHNLQVEIQSNSLDPEIKQELESMINERENTMDYSTLPEIDHMIKSNSFGFEVQLSTDDGKIIDIVKEHIEEQKELELLQEEKFANILPELTDQLNKELDMYEKGELSL